MARPKTDRVSVSYRMLKKQKDLLKILAGFHVMSETAVFEKLINDEVERLRKDKKDNERLNHVTKIIKGNQ